MVAPELCLRLQPPACDPRASLYVGDLHPLVNEADLNEVFRKMGPIASILLCRDALSGKSLRYAYVNFVSHSDASKALDCLNHTDIKGIPIRIMWCQRDPLPRKNGVGNLFVKNLVSSVDSTQLQALFCKFGTVLSCKVAEENGKSKGFGFVQFDTEKSAMAALDVLHGIMIEGKKLYVSKFIKQSERKAAHEEPKFTNLYVKNLGEDMTEDLLRDQFSKSGKVSNLAIMKDSEGKSRGFGFVNFGSSEEAKKAVEALNGALLGSRYLFVGRAQKKAEREELLKRAHMERLNCHNEKLKASNLSVKNLNASVDEKKLKEHFSSCGQILSVKVMRHSNGISKGFGFVCFSNPENAKKALDTLNGTILEGRSLFVAIAQCKDHHFGASQNYYAQFSPRSVYPLNLNVLPQFHPFLSYFPPCPPLSDVLHQPIMCQHFGTNVGRQYPLATQSCNDHFFTCVPTRQRWQGNTRDQVYQQHSTTHSSVSTRGTNYGNPGCQNLGSGKKVNN